MPTSIHPRSGHDLYRSLHLLQVALYLVHASPHMCTPAARARVRVTDRVPGLACTAYTAGACNAAALARAHRLRARVRPPCLGARSAPMPACGSRARTSAEAGVSPRRRRKEEAQGGLGRGSRGRGHASRTLRAAQCGRALVSVVSRWCSSVRASYYGPTAPRPLRRARRSRRLSGQHSISPTPRRGSGISCGPPQQDVVCSRLVDRRAAVVTSGRPRGQ